MNNRLLAVACARKVSYLIDNDSLLDAIDVAEKYAYGKSTKEELINMNNIAKKVICDMGMPTYKPFIINMTQYKMAASMCAEATCIVDDEYCLIMAKDHMMNAILNEAMFKVYKEKELELLFEYDQMGKIYG